MKDGVFSLVTRKKKPSGASGGAPNDESNDNSGHRQQHEQDADLLPRALLREDGGTESLLTKTIEKSDQKRAAASSWHTERLGESDHLGATHTHSPAAQGSPCVAAGNPSGRCCSETNIHTAGRLYPGSGQSNRPHLARCLQPTLRLWFNMFGKVLKIMRKIKENSPGLTNTSSQSLGSSFRKHHHSTVV